MNINNTHNVGLYNIYKNICIKKYFLRPVTQTDYIYFLMVLLIYTH